MEPCPHTNWIAEATTDAAGMVTEHCANPLCNATRKVFGNWEALLSAKLVDAGPVRWRVFPKLGHDTIDDIMREIKSGGGMVLSGAISSQPDPIEGAPVTTAAPVLEVKASPPLRKENRPRGGKSRERRPYGYMKKNKQAILRDIHLMGPEAARKQWNVPVSTWALYMNTKWKDEIEHYRATPLQEGPGNERNVLIPSCPCPEMLEIRAYRQAVQDLVRIAGGLQRDIRDILKEGKNGKPTGRNSKQGKDTRKLRKPSVEQG